MNAMNKRKYKKTRKNNNFFTTNKNWKNALKYVHSMFMCVSMILYLLFYVKKIKEQQSSLPIRNQNQVLST